MATNLLLNGGWEAGTTGWFSVHNLLAVQGVVKRSGDYAAEVPGDGATNIVAAIQIVPVTAGNIYDVNLWTKNAEGAGSSGYYFSWRDVSGAAIGANIIRYGHGITDWKLWTARQVAPVGAVDLLFRLTVRADNASLVYFDDGEVYAAGGGLSGLSALSGLSGMV